MLEVDASMLLLLLLLPLVFKTPMLSRNKSNSVWVSVLNCLPWSASEVPTSLLLLLLTFSAGSWSESIERVLAGGSWGALGEVFVPEVSCVRGQRASRSGMSTERENPRLGASPTA